MINTSNSPWNNLTYFDLGDLETFHKTIINIWIVFITINKNLLSNLYLKMLCAPNIEIDSVLRDGCQSPYTQV